RSQLRCDVVPHVSLLSGGGSHSLHRILIKEIVVAEVETDLSPASLLGSIRTHRMLVNRLQSVDTLLARWCLLLGGCKTSTSTSAVVAASGHVDHTHRRAKSKQPTVAD